MSLGDWKPLGGSYGPPGTLASKSAVESKKKLSSALQAGCLIHSPGRAGYSLLLPWTESLLLYSWRCC